MKYLLLVFVIISILVLYFIRSNLHPSNLSKNISITERQSNKLSDKYCDTLDGLLLRTLNKGDFDTMNYIPIGYKVNDAQLEKDSAYIALLRGKEFKKLAKERYYPFENGLFKDTLIDLNNDNYLDVLVEYYGSAGTGIKNRIHVLLYDSKRKKLVSCEELNALANPTFYFDKNIIVGYYIAAGCGFAAKYKWDGLGLDTLEVISECHFNEGDYFSFETKNYLTGEQRQFKTKCAVLPEEYNQIEYINLITSDYKLPDHQI